MQAVLEKLKYEHSRIESGLMAVLLLIKTVDTILNLNGYSKEIQ